MNKTITQSKLTINGTTFVIAAALFMTVFHNSFFFYQAWTLVDTHSMHNVLFLASMPVVLFLLLNTVFSLLLLPGIRKPIIILFLFVGASINYFIYSFNIVIDGNMVENALATNTHEAFDLFTYKMGLWLLLLAIIPTILIVKVKIRPVTSFYKAGLVRLINIMVSVLILLLITGLFYKDYAPFFRNNKAIIKTLVPSNVIGGLINVINDRIDASRPFVTIGLDAKKGDFIQHQAKKTLVILVVGETARAENFSLGGYSRDTNPRLGGRKDVIYFDNVSSCGTATAISLPCMFSNMSREDYQPSRAKYQSGAMDILATAGVNVLWRENDGGCKGTCDRVVNENVTTLNLSQYCQDNACLDGALLYQLDQHLNKLSDDSIIVLHQMGSHGPSYYQRYPDEFKKFTPDCPSNSIQDCDTESLVNTYDNTILYTDAVLDNTIRLLEKYDDKFATMMVYVSDHGESLGENGIYLHGAPYAFAPSQQTHIPLLTWMSKDYQAAHQIDISCLANEAKNGQFSHDNLFHSLLGIFDIQTTEYQTKLDIFNACRLKS